MNELFQENTNQIQNYSVSKQEYSQAQQALKPIKRFHAQKGTYYEIEGLAFKDKIFFKAIETGWVTVKYRQIAGKDFFAFSGKGKLEICHEITEGMNQTGDKENG